MSENGKDKLKAPAAGPQPKPSVLKTPSEWAKELVVKPHYVAGAARYAGWSDDAKISKSEFERKLAEWLKRPVGARR
jgi:hypothetical protein